MPWLCRSIATGLLLLVAPGAAWAEECAAPAARNDGWRVAAPAAEGFDPAILCAAGPRFEGWAQANVHAVLVVHRGRLVYERYFTGQDERWGLPLGAVKYDADTRHDLRSITKSVTSIVFGIAVARGWIKDIDAPVFSFFPEYAELKTPEKERITIRHLLTMSSGLAWNENVPYGSPANSENQMTRAPDRARYVLEQPAETPAGAVHNYSGGATEMLSAILTKATGRAIDALAEELLFAPLGITDAEWIRYADGKPIAASGLRLRPRDLAKIGQLVLSRGQWDGKEIVPAAWIEQSTAAHIQGRGLFFYGFQWWLGRSLVEQRPVEWVAAVGLGGQRVFIVPSRQLVVLVHAGLYRSPLQDFPGAVMLNRYVLPALARP